MNIGDKFGQLTVRTIGRKCGVVCSCGVELEVWKGNLVSGNTKSCGCTARERMGLGRITHGHTRNHEITGVWRSWHKMLERVKYPEFNPHYIGVTICDRWQKFENFYADMGERPEGMSLDRYPDPSGNYEPSNCRWATDAQQSQNRRPWKHTPEGLMRINAER